MPAPSISRGCSWAGRPTRRPRSRGRVRPPSAGSPSTVSGRSGSRAATPSSPSRSTDSRSRCRSRARAASSSRARSSSSRRPPAVGSSAVPPVDEPEREVAARVPGSVVLLRVDGVVHGEGARLAVELQELREALARLRALAIDLHERPREAHRRHAVAEERRVVETEDLEREVLEMPVDERTARKARVELLDGGAACRPEPRFGVVDRVLLLTAPDVAFVPEIAADVWGKVFLDGGDAVQRRVASAAA